MADKPSQTAGSSEHHEDIGLRAAEFVRLLSTCERRLHTYVLAMVGNLTDADDVIQETNVRLWEQFAEYRGNDFGNWACAIAYYQVLSFRKRTNRVQKFSDDFFAHTAREMNARADELEARQHALGYCLEKLSPADRELVLTSYSGQHTIQQVATLVGRSVTATYQALWRIRNSLRRCVEHRLKMQGDAG